ncbi:MAG: hypothetical protein K9K66_10255 [Desulfarculaceae bacterium]|nr:hypothetical protein [Desulfarculaceae bacterium]MCF8073790.1 hypothetical protein [Desulfarculaceae bacterium]MCF8102031.1 hypothetical protein [Desulfarculaceae bacterium]MCF8116001.1 hypothetical protein [Desulfarculaceae bacterium]
MSHGIQIIDPEERFTLSLEGASFTLRRIDSATLVALERRGEGGSAALNDEILDYILIDWEGVTSPLGSAEVPCTRENKLHLPGAVKLKLLGAAQGLRAGAETVH